MLLSGKLTTLLLNSNAMKMEFLLGTKIYLRGCWMLFMGLFGTEAAGLWAWAAWLLSIVIVFWLGLVESWTLSMGLFWDNPMMSTGSPLAARSEFGALCWTILMPPAFTTSPFVIRTRRRNFVINNFLSIWWVGFFQFKVRNQEWIHLPAGALPATFTFDSSSDIISIYLIFFNAILRNKFCSIVFCDAIYDFVVVKQNQVKLNWSEEKVFK